MNRVSIIKSLIYSLFGLGLITLGVSLFFLNEVNHFLGANTEVVEFAQFQTVSGKLAITNVSVLSTNADSMVQNQTVIINGQKIESVEESHTIPEGCHLIDGTGKYLIPGLIDSHVHLKKSKNDLLLYLANGVTHVGEMTGLEGHFQWLKEIDEGALGPGIYIASPKITSRNTTYQKLKTSFEKRMQYYTTPEEAREGVREYKALGYKAIKLSSTLQPEIYFALTDEARKQGIPAIGHLPMQITLEDLYRSGQSQLSHISEITKATERAFGKVKPVYYKNTEEYLNYVRQRADSIALQLKEKNIVVASTIWIHEAIPQITFDLPNFLKTIELEYMNPGWVEGSAISGGWLPGNSTFENPDNTSSEDMRLSALYWNTKVEAEYILLLALVRNGVSITAGTDANGAHGAIPGFSLQQELISLHNAGLKIQEVLKAATTAPANWMKLNAGKIEVGYEADLVLLNKNPLEKISHTKCIEAVITNGKYLDRTELDKMLLAVKKANNRSRKVSINQYTAE